jgi:hypothetical protein
VGRPTGQETLQTRPPPGWRAALLTPGTWEFLLGTYTQLKAHGRHRSPLGASIRTFLVQLAGITGEIFSPDTISMDTQQALGVR